MSSSVDNITANSWCSKMCTYLKHAYDIMLSILTNHDGHDHSSKYISYFRDL